MKTESTGKEKRRKLRQKYISLLNSTARPNYRLTSTPILSAVFACRT